MFKNFKRALGTCFFVALSTNLAFALDVPSNKIVDVNWLEQNLKDKDLVLVDVRESEDAYKTSHIPNAIRWTFGDYRETRLNVPVYLGAPATFEKIAQKSGITADSVVVFYSDGDKSPTDFSLATVALHASGLYGVEKTAILNGGFAAWVKNGKAVDANVPAPKNSSFKVTKVVPEDVATIYDIDEAIIENDSHELLDGRSDVFYKGQKAHPKAAKSGHIANAKSVFVGKFVEKKDGVFYFKSADGIKEALVSSGVDLNKPILWYCNSGQTASLGWFATKYVLGDKDVKVYDGSMFEYTKLPERKVVK